MTIVQNCKCEHEYQDRVYGKGKRLMNATSKEGQYRCTVCGTTANGAVAKK